MVPAVIIASLLALGGGIVAWATRPTRRIPSTAGRVERAAENDPIGSSRATPTDPFAHAPLQDLEPRS